MTLATTCHDRREKTLSAQSDLHSQERSEFVSAEHVIVDDGRTDGTAEAVAKQFPDVEIVPGAGLFSRKGLYGQTRSDTLKGPPKLETGAPSNVVCDHLGLNICKYIDRSLLVE